jgi:hypothetical protein
MIGILSSHLCLSHASQTDDGLRRHNLHAALCPKAISKLLHHMITTGKKGVVTTRDIPYLWEESIPR